jgi:SAM-dependent methyltransferase
MKALVPRRLRNRFARARKRLRTGWRRRPATVARIGEWPRYLFELVRFVRSGVRFTSASARRYCVGRGLEIGGAAHNPFGLRSLNVDVTGSLDTAFKKLEIAACGKALPVDMVASGDAIPVADGSQDFVVSSHVLEHMPDPIGAMLEWDRVVRPGGVMFMIVPHKERTFDKQRPRTAIEHLIADHSASTPEPHGDANGHDHVWVTQDLVEVVEWMGGHLGVQWQILEVQDRDDKVGNGFTVIVRKCATRHALPDRDPA